MALNIWRRFGNLIKPPAEEVVTVTAINGNGTITGRTLAGGITRARCALTDVVVGNRVFTAGGQVSGKAPDLTYHEVEI